MVYLYGVFLAPLPFITCRAPTFNTFLLSLLFVFTNPRTMLCRTDWDIEARVFTPPKITLSACVVCWSKEEEEQEWLSQAKYQAPCNRREVLIWKCTCRRRHRRTHSSRHEPLRGDCDAKDVSVRRVRKAFCAALPVRPGCGTTFRAATVMSVRAQRSTSMTNRWSLGGLRIIYHGSERWTSEWRSGGEDLKQSHHLSPNQKRCKQLLLAHKAAFHIRRWWQGCDVR